MYPVRSKGGQGNDLIGAVVRELVQGARGSNPIIDVAMRVLASQRQQREYENEDDRSSFPVDDEAAKKRFIKALVNMETALLLILGAKGTGKTALSMRLLDLYGEHGKKLYALSIGNLPTHIQGIEDLEELPNGSAVVLDDTNILFSNTSYYTDAGRMLHKLITLARHKELIIIANSHQSAAVNRYLLQADALFLKPQNTLVEAYERRALLRLVQEAASAYRGMSLDEMRGCVYAVGISAYLPPFRGLIAYLPPDWFDNRVSKNKARS